MYFGQNLIHDWVDPLLPWAPFRHAPLVLAVGQPVYVTERATVGPWPRTAAW